MPTLVRRRPVERGVVFYHHSVKSLMGTQIVMMGNALELSFQSGGMGGFIEETFILEGMQDPDDPWEKDPGDLIVKVPASLHTLRTMRPVVRESEET